MMQLDIRGQVCPNATGVVFTTLRQLPAGETLEVTSDYPPARTTIPMLARQLDGSCTIHDGEGAEFVAVISIGNANSSVQDQEEHHGGETHLRGNLRHE